MLITNGILTRNISEERLHEYVSKGYEVVKTSTPEKPSEKAKKPKQKKGDK